MAGAARSGVRRDAAPLVIAHRGASDAAPENTLAAFRQAAADGADCIEFDVACTADGELVVLHDDTVNRTTDGAGPVNELTLKQVKRLDAGRWKGEQFAGERIPTLDETLSLAAELGLGVYIEWKPQLRTVRHAVSETLAAVRRHGLEQQTIVQSFAPELVAEGARTDAGWRVELLTFRPRADALAQLQALGATGYNPFHMFVTGSFVARLHQAGMRVSAWTVNSGWAMRRLARYCDGIISDRPARLRSIVDKR